MSVTVYWNPVDKTILDGATSDVVAALTKVFGQLPVNLSMNDMDKLLGMSATWSLKSPNPYETLTNAIVKFGVIEVIAEY